MGNDMFNDEQLAYMKTQAVQYDTACVDCRHDAGKDAPDTTWQCAGHIRAERDFLRAKLAMKWTIEEQYEAACGDRDALLRMVETLRPRVSELEKDVRALTNERNAAITLAEQRGAAYDVTWREVESLRERLDKSDEERGRQYGLRLEIADEFAGEVAFLRELLVVVIKTGTKDPLLDARLAEELRGHSPAPSSPPAPASGCINGRCDRPETHYHRKADDASYGVICMDDEITAAFDKLRTPPPASEALARFGAAMLTEWWDDGNPGDIDGGMAQTYAEKFGLWGAVERHADGVECEWCGNEGPCGELTEAGLAALSASGAGEENGNG